MKLMIKLSALSRRILALCLYIFLFFTVLWEKNFFLNNLLVCLRRLHCCACVQAWQRTPKAFLCNQKVVFIYLFIYFCCKTQRTQKHVNNGICSSIKCSLDNRAMSPTVSTDISSGRYLCVYLAVEVGGADAGFDDVQQRVDESLTAAHLLPGLLTR